LFSEPVLEFPPLRRSVLKSVMYFWWFQHPFSLPSDAFRVNPFSLNSAAGGKAETPQHAQRIIRDDARL
jgi:hypothetical protein